jgi:hypothetical protein
MVSTCLILVQDGQVGKPIICVKVLRNTYQHEKCSANFCTRQKKLTASYLFPAAAEHANNAKTDGLHGQCW